MANAKRCDRCGEFYMPDKEKNLDNIQVGVFPHVGGFQAFDLCPECAEMLEEFCSLLMLEKRDELRGIKPCQ